MNPLTKIIEKEGELQKLAVDGENVINYFSENPDKKQTMIEKYHKLRDEIAELDIPNAYRESMLESINKYLNKLNSNPSGNNNSNLLYGALGAVVGSTIVYGLDNFMKKLEEKVANGVVKGIYKGDGK